MEAHVNGDAPDPIPLRLKRDQERHLHRRGDLLPLALAVGGILAALALAALQWWAL